MHVSEHNVVDDRGFDMHVRPRWIGKLTGNLFRNDTMCVRQDELQVGVVYIVRLTYAVLPVTFALFADSAQCVALQVLNDMSLRDLGRVVVGDTTLGSRKVVAGTPVRLVLSHGKEADDLTKEKKCVVYDLVFPVNYADSIQHLKPDADDMLPSWQTIPACMLDRKLSPTAFVATSVLIRVGVDADTKTSKPNGSFMFTDDKYPTIAAYTEAQQKEGDAGGMSQEHQVSQAHKDYVFSTKVLHFGDYCTITKRGGVASGDTNINAIFVSVSFPRGELRHVASTGSCSHHDVLWLRILGPSLGCIKI